MIEKLWVVKTSDQQEFFNDLQKKISEMQSKDLKVDVQYQPLLAEDNDVIIYTAMIIGRSETKFNPNYRIGDEW